MSLRMTIIFEIGIEHAPDSPWGMDRLTVEPSGLFSYENRQSGHLRKTGSGRIEPWAIEQIARDLADAGFPTVPEHAKPPGGNYVTIVAKTDGADQEAFMRGSAAERFVGYGPLVMRVREWVKYLRGNATADAPPELHLDS